MKLFLFLSFVGALVIYFGAKDSAAMDRCTDRHSIDYCRVVFYGR